MTLPAGLLSKPSVVNVTQLFAVDRDLLEERIAGLAGVELRAVDDGLRLALGL